MLVCNRPILSRSISFHGTCLAFILSLSMCGCKNIEITEVKYPNGNIREKYETIKGKNNKFHVEGSYYSWYENGQKKEEGTVKGSGARMWIALEKAPFDSVYIFDDCFECTFNGTWTTWFNNGNKHSEQAFVKGKPASPRTTWHLNGNKETEISLPDDKGAVLFEQWHENGGKALEATIVKGELNGIETKWYKTGEKFSETLFRKGKPEGVSTSWYTNGNKASQSNFKNGVPEGLFTYWSPNGEIRKQEEYKNGEVWNILKQ